jgi:hypothetical protein
MSTQIEKNLRILIVDDSRAIHDDFRKILAGKNRAQTTSDTEAELFGTPTNSPMDISFELVKRPSRW